MTGLIIAGVALLIAAVFGVYRLRTDGHFKAAARGPAVDSAWADDDSEPLAEAGPIQTDKTEPGWVGILDQPLGERATLVQFSSAFCAPCRATKVILNDVATTTDGVVHVEIDAESHLDLVRAHNIMRTPTTIILDGSGAEVARAAGAPRKDQVLNALPTA